MRRRAFISSLIGFGAAGIILSGFARAEAAELRVFSTGAFKEALGLLAPAFEKLQGHSVVMIQGNTEEIIRRIGAGETVDVVIAPIPLIDQMLGRGVVVPGSRRDVAKSGIGVAARMGAPMFDVASSNTFRR